MSEDRENTPNPGTPRSTQILDTILEDLNDRRGFRQEFDKIDEDTLVELNTEVTGVIDRTLGDPSIEEGERAKAIVDAVIDDLSDRRGLRQGFFDQLSDDEQEDDSRPGIARELISKVEPLIQQG